MGNITSNEGDNFTEDGIQTPLNKFVEKVMNEDYFFTPNVSDDMIQNVDKSDINNNKVLLKRALCTGTTFIPISLPYVTCDEINSSVCEGGNYTVKINATDENGIKLPDIETIQGQSYIDAYNNATLPEAQPIRERIITKLTNGDPLTATEREILDVYKYLSVSTGNNHGDAFTETNPSDPDNPYTYKTSRLTPESINNSRIGDSLGCRIFYRGTDKGIKYSEANDPSGNNYNSYDPRFENTSNSKAFCGKVMQYNSNASRRNGELVEKIGQFTPRKRREGNQFRTDEFKDCACLNSALAVQQENIEYINNEAARLARERGKSINLDTGKNVTGESLAQNNDDYCKNNLSDFDSGAPGAYAATNEYRDVPLQICSSVSLLQGLDQSGGTFDAGTDCGFSSEDTDRILKCIKDKNAPGCKQILEGEGIGDDSKEEEEKSKNNILMIVIIVLVLLVVVGAAFYFIKIKGKGKGKKTSVSEPSIEPAKIKYAKPSSDPLYRELN